MECWKLEEEEDQEEIPLVAVVKKVQAVSCSVAPSRADSVTKSTADGLREVSPLGLCQTFKI